MKKPVEVAFILAAGRGERLRPLTDKIPKPLLQYRGRPLLDHILSSLEPLRLKRVVVNAWHLKEQILEWADEKKSNLKFELIVSQEDELLGTGGGLRKALPLIGEQSFLMLNGDCLWKGDIENFCKRAQETNFSSVWWLTSAQRDQTLIGVKSNELVQIGKLWMRTAPEQTGCFTGIQFVQKIDASRLPVKGCIIRNYLIPELDQNAIRVGADFQGLISWTDIGTVERYQSLN